MGTFAHRHPAWAKGSLYRRFLTYVLCFFTILSCVTAILSSPFNRDPLVLTVGSASFDPQRFKLGDKSCEGDWVLRRERLRLLEGELFGAQADILILQGVVAKSTSTYDSDEIILKAGSLGDFKWLKTLAHYYSEVDEDEYFVVAAKQGILSDQPLPLAEVRAIGQDGRLVLQTLNFSEQPAVTIANLYLPTSAEKWPQAYPLINETIESYLKQQKSCGNRLILSGFVGDAKAREFQMLLKGLELFDSTANLCQDGVCVSPTRDNPFFAAQEMRANSNGSYRLYVPHSSRLIGASVFLHHPSPHKLFSEKYHFDQLWPSTYPGELVQIKLANCP